MNLTEHIMTRNDCYKAGRTIQPKGIMVHSPGVAQPDVSVFLRLWNKPDVDRCVHAFVHQDGVTMTLPWNWRGWHAGTPPEGGISANNTHIGFEILEPAGHTYRNGSEMVGYNVEKNAPYFAKVYHNAVELCALLCRKYHLNPLTDIVDHREGHQRRIASNHADVSHWFPKHGKSMDTLRADVKALLDGKEEGEDMTQAQFNTMFAAAMAEYNKQLAARPASPWAAQVWKKAAAAGVLDGTQPQAPLSREQAALVLDRLHLLPDGAPDGEDLTALEPGDPELAVSPQDGTQDSPAE
ncbi:N-acetylmuramoyl-L-alanine amidase [Pseudoflavonifractor sp. 524-17]|uniref:peptidoglycan recognition protein family protein n=1 Tax=Pseudoflavonifractor sp. 524-17 TaxID=2304577 RepID=UPI001379535A|nr:peptidoglycan recognition family protein [Pseudoflavonifractor sp. 524-17]NCE65700.1 N-acetylmuramoyl-L-alanine amidase [Pseudoflavonifractor sp. 524-17]